MIGLSTALSPSGHSLIEPSVDAPSVCCIPYAVAASIAGSLVYFYLPESPVFLAGAGRLDEASHALEQMCRLDGRDPDESDSTCKLAVGVGKVLTLSERLGAMCSGCGGPAVPLLLSCTIWATNTSGLVMSQEYLPKTDIFFSAAVLGRWYGVACNLLKIAGEVVAYINATHFSRCVALGNTLLWFALWTTLFFLLIPLRDVGGIIVEATTQVAGAMIVYGNRIVLTVGYLMAVEAFPTMCSVTAGSIIIRMGGSDGRYMGMMSLWGWVSFGALPFCLAAQMALLAMPWYFMHDTARDTSLAPLPRKVPQYGSFGPKLGA